jgi:hypothetical protein
VYLSAEALLFFVVTLGVEQEWFGSVARVLKRCRSSESDVLSAVLTSLVLSVLLLFLAAADSPLQQLFPCSQRFAFACVRDLSAAFRPLRRKGFLCGFLWLCACSCSLHLLSLTAILCAVGVRNGSAGLFVPAVSLRSQLAWRAKTEARTW